MKFILASLLLFGRLLAAELPDIAGVWEPSGGKHRCMCGHASQLVMTQMGDPTTYKINEYCLGHGLAVPLGHLKRSGTELKLDMVNKSLKFTLSEDGRTLTLTGDALSVEQPLVLNRIHAETFWKALSKIPAHRLVLSRSSSLIRTGEPEPGELLR